MSTQAVTAENETDTDADRAAFSWTVPLHVDQSQNQRLHRAPAQVNAPEEEHFPREVIAEQIGASRLQADLARPLLIGTFRGLPAYLLRTRFHFQRVTTNWMSRVRAAEVSIIFEDAPLAAPVAQSQEEKMERTPAVAAFYPELFEGDVTGRVVNDIYQVSLNATYMGAGVTATMGQNTEMVEKGRVIVHGMRGGSRKGNVVTWSIEEDRVALAGIPRKIELPLIVTHGGGGRFSARVTVKAHYGFWRGTLARSMPVLGKNDAPLYFDPTVLASLATKTSNQGPDGRSIVEDAGLLDGVRLADHSSFPAIPN